MGINAIKLDSLPSDLIHYTASYLSKRDKKSLKLTCKHLFDLFKRTLVVPSNGTFNFHYLTKVKVSCFLTNIELPSTVRSLSISLEFQYSLTHLTMLNTLKLMQVDNYVLDSLKSMTNLRKLNLSSKPSPSLLSLTQLTSLGVKVEGPGCFKVISKLPLKELKIIEGIIDPGSYQAVSVESLKIKRLKMSRPYLVGTRIELILNKMGHSSVKRISAPGILRIKSFLAKFPSIELLDCWGVIMVDAIDENSIRKWLTIKVEFAFFRSLNKRMPAAVAEMFYNPSIHMVEIYKEGGLKVNFAHFELFEDKNGFHSFFLTIFLESILKEAYLNLEKFCDLLKKDNRRESHLDKIKELTPPESMPEFLFIQLYFRGSAGSCQAAIDQHFEKVYEIAVRYPDGGGEKVLKWLILNNYKIPSYILDICLQLHQKSLVPYFQHMITFQDCKEAILKGDYTLIKRILDLFAELPSERNDLTLYHFALKSNNEAVFTLVLESDASGDELLREVEGMSILEWARNKNPYLYRKILERFPKINRRKRLRRKE